MTKRLYQLDILRFLAAVSVAFFHYSYVFYNRHHHYLINNDQLNSCFLYGNLGVQLFFIISGFVILMSARNQTPRRFVISRIVRLYPAFVPVCIFTFILASLTVPGYNVSYKDFFLNLSLIGTFFSEKLVSGVYWTLKTEILFYVFIYLLLISKQINKIRFFLNAWLVISFVTYFSIEYHYFNYFRIFNVIRYLGITEHSYYFIAGCYFYLIKYDRKRGDILIPIICMAGAILAYPATASQDKLVTSLIIVFLFIVFYWLSLKKDSQTTQGNLYYNLGETTYPLYLLHEVIGMCILSSFAYLVPGPLLLIVTLVFVILVSFGVNKWVEKPIRNVLKNVLH